MVMTRRGRNPGLEKVKSKPERTRTKWVNFELLQKASRKCGWLSPDPVIPRNQMGGSTPACYNGVNSKLLLTLGGLRPAMAGMSGRSFLRRMQDFVQDPRGLPRRRARFPG